MRLLQPILALTQSMLAAGAPLAAQCTMQWHPGPGTDGPVGTVNALLPLSGGELLAGGTFEIADHTIVRNLARWNGTSWQTFGAGTDGHVQCLVRLTNGDIVAAGSFTTMDGVPCNRIARWDGSAWSPLGTGCDGPINRLVALANGGLFAAGSFTMAGGAPAGRMARWNGSTWTPLPAGVPLGTIMALAELPNGDLVVGGAFAGHGLQRLSAGAWSAIPGFDPSPPPVVTGLAVLANGNLAVSGWFRVAAVQYRLALVGSGGVVPMAHPLASPTGATLVTSNGDLVVGGNPPGATLARWNGASWSTSTSGLDATIALAELPNGDLAIGASSGAASPPRATVARFDGFAWQTLGAGPPPIVRAGTTLANGDAVVGGSFQTLGGVPATNIARWNGTTWAALGTGVDGPVSVLAASANGDLVAAGAFQTAGGAPASRIARWNGTTWSAIGNGLAWEPVAVTALTNGDVLASNGTSLWRFDGTTWQQAAVSLPLTIRSMAALPNGEAIVVGAGFLATTLRYTGGTLTPIAGAPPGDARRVVVLSDGSVVVATTLSVHRWDGLVWSPMPGGIAATGLAALPGDVLVACGEVTTLGTPAASALYHLAGGAWTPFGGVVGGTAAFVITTPRGEILVGGNTTQAGGIVSWGVARASPTCAGAVGSVGVACSGFAGLLALQTTELPFVGTSFRATTTGLFVNSVALAFAGTPSAAVPVPGAPGCFGYLNPFVSEMLFPIAGAATLVVPVPNDAALVGVQLRLQVAAVEFGATARIATTNALDLTVGSYGL